ncbi:unnamed protein product [Closterium sp. Yama58-4]|nr:unnamed protein product [Closterium sp. Yama58-4]
MQALRARDSPRAGSDAPGNDNAAPGSRNGGGKRSRRDVDTHGPPGRRVHPDPAVQNSRRSQFSPFVTRALQREFHAVHAGGVVLTPGVKTYASTLGEADLDTVEVAIDVLIFELADNLTIVGAVTDGSGLAGGSTQELFGFSYGMPLSTMKYARATSHNVERHLCIRSVKILARSLSSDHTTWRRLSSSFPSMPIAFAITRSTTASDGHFLKENAPGCGSHELYTWDVVGGVPFAKEAFDVRLYETFSTRSYGGGQMVLKITVVAFWVFGTETPLKTGKPLTKSGEQNDQGVRWYHSRLRT